MGGERFNLPLIKPGAPPISGGMHRWVVLLVLWVCLGASLWGKGVRYGMNRVEIEAILGQPSAVLTQGARLVLLYPKSGRIELEQGVAVRIVNVPVDIGESAASPALPAPAQTEAAARSPVKAADQAQLEAEARMEQSRQAFQRRLEEATEKLSENPRPVPIEIVPRPAVFWTGLLVAWVLRTLLTVVVLKMAFKWSDVHADWSQMFLPALADTITQAVIGATVYALWKTDHLFHLDVAVSYFVLLGVLMKTTHACTLQRAVAVAGAAKLASIVMWALVSVMMLNLLT